MTRLTVATLLALGTLAIPASAAQRPAGLPARCGAPRELTGGASVLFCVPRHWNRRLVLFAHGYTAPGQPLAFQNLDLPLTPPSPLAASRRTTTLPRLVMKRGYAFAATTYRENGLAIRFGVEDLIDLRRAFVRAHGRPKRTYATGVSEGGLVVARLAERRPRQATGALAACAPLGSFQRELDHLGDFRVLFDVLFPQVIVPRWTPASPAISAPVLSSWLSGALPARVLAALQADIPAAVRLIGTSKVAVDASLPAALRASAAQATLDVLQYDVTATNDAMAKLGGNPYGNVGRSYSDPSLDQQVARFTADRRALRTLARRYETTGALRMPLVSLHTTGDDVVPASQQRLYARKVRRAGRRSLLTVRRVGRWGHCAFTAGEVLRAFDRLVAATSR
jgi:pimeloyl-ACP methyl ester carboxylesterase